MNFKQLYLAYLRGAIVLSAVIGIVGFLGPLLISAKSTLAVLMGIFLIVVALPVLGYDFVMTFKRIVDDMNRNDNEESENA